jgi:protein SPA2
MNGHGRILTELSNLSRQNGGLMRANDADLVVMRDLDLQLKEYKQKYEQAKTELGSVKGAPIPIFFFCSFYL